jgi:SAM-dependent methyltransferase
MEKNKNIYYQGNYWNKIPAVFKEINRRLTGDPNLDWVGHFQSVAGKVFKKALFINCGNGWVERGFIDRGIVLEAVGLDVNNMLLEQARKNSNGRALRYYACDINLADFIEDGFDLVVNHAAGHHIKFIDRVFRKIALALGDGGVFVSMDYVGPHRNQYPEQQWDAIKKLNISIDARFQADLVYPDLLTMLATDPSEAVHSELIVPTVYKYFDVSFHTKAGGALAYPILTHNHKFFGQNVDDWECASEPIMAADLAYLEQEPDSSMFDYIIATPKYSVALSLEQEADTDLYETRRELRALQAGGFYEFPAWIFGSEVSFQLGESGHRFFCEGFSFSEPHGTWTDGYAARLRFCGPVNKPFRLEFNIAPFQGLNSNYSQRVFVVLNGRFLVCKNISRPEIFTVDTSYPFSQLDGEYELTFILPDAIQSRDEYGIILDGRLLGVLFISARLIDCL